jgi:hypothetical protein
MSINCPKCFTANHGEAKFCRSCGHDLQVSAPAAPGAANVTCSRCTADNTASAKFCRVCGLQLIKSGTDEELDITLVTAGPFKPPPLVAPPQSSHPLPTPSPASAPVMPSAVNKADDIVFDSFIAKPPAATHTPSALPAGPSDSADPNATVAWVNPAKQRAAVPPPLPLPPPLPSPPPPVNKADPDNTFGWVTPGPSAPQENRETTAAPVPTKRGSAFGLVAGAAIAGVIALGAAGYWFLANSSKKASAPVVAAAPTPAPAPAAPAPEPAPEPVAAPPAAVLPAPVPAPEPAPAVISAATPDITSSPSGAQVSPAGVAALPASAASKPKPKPVPKEKIKPEVPVVVEPPPRPVAPPPVVAAPPAPPPVAPAPPMAPREACGGRVFVALARCMDQQCKGSNHPQCVEHKRTQEEIQRKRDYPEAGG